jgi:hypothetical protein
MFCAVAPPVFALKVILGIAPMTKETMQLGGKIMGRVRTPIPAISLPGQAGGSSAIRKNAEDLIVNLAKGIVAFVVLQFARNFAEQFPAELYMPASVDISLLFDIGHLVVLAYFGYRVLVPVKFFMDVASDFVVTKLQITRTMYARVSLDFLYVTILGISWSVASPFIARLAGDMSLLLLPANMLFFGITALLLYDMLRTLYRGLRGHWDALMSNLAERVSTSLLAPENKVARHEEDNVD